MTQWKSFVQYLWRAVLTDCRCSKKPVLCLSDEESPDESMTVLHTGLHEFAFSFNLPQMWVCLLKCCVILGYFPNSSRVYLLHYSIHLTAKVAGHLKKKKDIIKYNTLVKLKPDIPCLFSLWPLTIVIRCTKAAFPLYKVEIDSLPLTRTIIVCSMAAKTELVI